MFDMGFTEMMLIGIVALIVIGPERLPGVARTAGKYFGRLKRFMTTVKADVEQELRADELREILAKQQQELDSLKDTITDAGKEIEEAGKEIEKEASALQQSGEELVDRLDQMEGELPDDVSHADMALDEENHEAEAHAAADDASFGAADASDNHGAEETAEDARSKVG